ncbi:MAG: carboxypeptidase regulatory-like domain-containing protein [Desulfarculus sp.]|nr:MAG: carboxypeptidase regulatory-like domain-containing protein [Desulfarculus sp.]
MPRLIAALTLLLLAPAAALAASATASRYDEPPPGQGQKQPPAKATPDERRQYMDSLRVRDQLLKRQKKEQEEQRRREALDPGPMREVMVIVTDQDGNPVSEAEVTVTTAAEGRIQEGSTTFGGTYLTMVRCYLPGIYEVLMHEVRVVSPLGVASETFTTDANNCGLAAEVHVTMEGSGSEEEKQLRMYRERQKGYEDEDEQPPPEGLYRDPYAKPEEDLWKKRFPERPYPGQYQSPAQKKLEKKDKERKAREKEEEEGN